MMNVKSVKLSANIDAEINAIHFGDELRQQRHQANFTQQYLADIAEVSLRQIQGFEANTTSPTLETLFRIAKALKITPDTLIMPVWKNSKYS